MTPPNIGDEGEVLSPALKATPSSDALVSRRTLVQALADTFGDSGWFGGRMGAIVHAAMQAFEIEEVD